MGFFRFYGSPQVFSQTLPNLPNLLFQGSKTIKYRSKIGLLAKNSRFWPRTNGKSGLFDDSLRCHALLQVVLFIKIYNSSAVPVDRQKLFSG